MKILQINASARRLQADGKGSDSARLAHELVQGLIAQADAGAASVALLDLAINPHPALDESSLQALFTPAEQRSPAQAERVALDSGLIEQLRAADVLVLAVPMINFGVPTQLKNWIDAVAKAGVTFRYTAQGPEGLLTGKKVYAVLTRGGIYRDQASDTMVPYLRTALGFLGLSDISFVYAEGLAMGADAAAQGLAAAREQISELVGAALPA
ncbi:FMN-dependent NADH-azoreductase [Roseateles oligotrophus]|uniref:FMN dependent NADH:quinone oxidoreductase n=1 Tax=Roseateles oligotrophus TaxID=1769250 RepID=A0ABT2YIP4_9BURK|nr:NAD(P)H-dependent oxidoreductase [Roseateles oligotrophus]MCV2369805.1 NAD(P)H-dependent oxidoreductase [Roseateles oligotrophus]